MPARRAAAAAFIAILAGCTTVTGDPSPAPPTFTEAVGSVALDAITPGGVDVLDLAAAPDGGTLALLADTADPAVTYLVPIDEDGVGAVRRLDDAGDRLFVTADGTVLVAGPGRLTTVGAGTVDLAVTGDVAALSPDGRRLYVANGSELAAVDPATGAVQGSVEIGEGYTVTALAAAEDGPIALMSDARATDLADVAVLGTWSADLEPGPVVELAPDRPASIPFALRLTGDGTAVVTLTAGSGDDPYRVVVVEDGEVTASHVIPGTDRTPADLALSPDGRIAYLPVAGFEVTSGVISLDLASGEQLADARLCEGQATFGRVALAADRLTVIGSCISGAAPSTTAFVVG
ncbi:hypothetical protein SAMN05660359_03392 [Geodermatophilus obscurus]|uniref:40-residue YVTN family beta-propeller repeat-containing protein n=1 Tax=Geodermatophilus obscurus TaxID=1861 RepID=A0A1I5H389_9ACTN|nr:hypothetical protein [Geodermatophilus obscurus]SFO42788.1 hypothetical protein SAMN05660359_03392 [Geodermatophilus obscurus]